MTTQRTLQKRAGSGVVVPLIWVNPSGRDHSGRDRYRVACSLCGPIAHQARRGNVPGLLADHRLAHQCRLPEAS